MKNPTIQAVTFDLWDTVFIDDSDEPTRKAQGLASKPIERRNLVHQFLSQVEPISREAVDTAYDVADAAFRHVWYEQNVTWSVRDRLSVILKGLNRQLVETEMDALVKFHETMEIHISPDIISGVAEAIAALHGKYKLVVISDTIFSPGWALREMLKNKNLFQYFDGFVFSDEQGCCKPNRAMFEAAAKSVGVDLSTMVHIGDREQKDIEGAHLVGARAVLCTAAIDRDSQNTKAEAICRDYNELSSLLENLSS